MRLIAKYPCDQGIRFYPVPTRFFNILFAIEDMQGDGFISFTFILFWRAMQITIWFNNNQHKWRQFDWRIFRKK